MEEASNTSDLRTEENPADGPPDAAASAEADPRAEGELELEIDEEGLQAVVVVVYPSTTIEQITELLKQHEIPGKFLAPQARTAVQVALETQQAVRSVVAAEGRAPRAADPDIVHVLPKKQSALPALDEIQYLLTGQDRSEIARRAPEVRGWLVRSGQTLAHLTFPVWASGMDVRGSPLPPLTTANASGEPDRRVPGPGVAVSADGLTWTAKIYGYAGLLGEQVCVLPPIWISADDMEACFVRTHLLAGSVIPSARHLRGLLEASGVTTGFDEDSLEAFATAQKQGETAPRPLFVLARGRAEVPPKSPRPIFTTEAPNTEGGTLRHDGTMDYKERGLFPTVKSDAVLAECDVAVPGEVGLTIRGVEISVPPPTVVELVAGENARAESADGVQRILSTAEGGVTVAKEDTRDEDGRRTVRHTISVLSLIHIPGDVDYETGNIEVHGNVIIDGSVESGFHVQATGNVVVNGTVEAGAQVVAGGGVTVGQGIIGEKTVVKAAADLTAKYVQDARVEAGADVTISSYARSAIVICGGHLQVEGSSGGGIVGGETWGMKGIRASNIGAEGSKDTKLYCGLEPSQLPRLLELKNGIRTAEDMLQRLLATSGLQSFDEAEIAKVTGHSQSRQDSVQKTIVEAGKHTENRDRAVEEERALLAKIEEASKLATIEVPDNAFAKCRIQIGVDHKVLEEDRKRVRFRASAEAGIVASDLD